MKKILCILLVSLFSSTCFAAEPFDTLHIKEKYSFSIIPLEKISDEITISALTMQLPSSAGFTPTLIVQISNYKGALDDYMTEIRKGVKEKSQKMIKETRLNESCATWEYSGAMEGRKLHFYNKAVLKDRKAYLVVSVAMEGQWPSVSEKIKSSVDSFQLENDEKTSAIER